MASGVLRHPFPILTQNSTKGMKIGVVPTDKYISIRLYYTDALSDNDCMYIDYNYTLHAIRVRKYENGTIVSQTEFSGTNTI